MACRRRRGSGNNQEEFDIKGERTNVWNINR